MIHWAANELDLAKTEKGFHATNRELLLQMEKSGKTPPELELSRNPPKPLFHVWEWFLQIAIGQPITQVEIAAFFHIRNIRPTRIELDTLTELRKLYHG